MARDQVFISYSRNDNQFLEELQTHLKPYIRKGAVTAWTEQQIAPGSQWFDEIKSALDKTSVAVLLVSPHFLASDFIHEHELALFLKEAKAGGVKILWVLIRDCAWGETPLKDYQAAIYPLDRAFASMTEAERDTAWEKVCQQIKRALTGQTAFVSPRPEGLPPSTAPEPPDVPGTTNGEAISRALVAALALTALAIAAYIAWSHRTRPPAPSPVEIRAQVDLSPGTVPPAARPAAVLGGYVTDAVTRVPLADVKLTIQDWDTRDGGSPTAVTDDAGRFRFEKTSAHPTTRCGRYASSRRSPATTPAPRIRPWARPTIRSS